MAKQHQNEHHDKNQPDPARPVMPVSIAVAATNPAKAAEQQQDQDTTSRTSPNIATSPMCYSITLNGICRPSLRIGQMYFCSGLHQRSIGAK